MEKPRAFISYSHKDKHAQPFVEVLVTYLDIHMDLFWDRRIKPAPFAKELEKEIETREFFLPVMTPSFARKDSYCRIELHHAEKHNRKIVPLKIILQYSPPECAKYSWADFTQGFERGFQDLTRKILGRSYLPWEHLENGTHREILEGLQRGMIPASIAREFGEWAIVEKLWPYIRNRLEKSRIHVGEPKSPQDILLLVPSIIEQAASNIDAVSVRNAQRTEKIIQGYLETEEQNITNDAALAGQNTMKLLIEVEHELENMAAARLDAREVIGMRHTSVFDATSQLRHLIKTHARTLNRHMS
ncbi:MAG: toll/interleukin-1 receptor domain-containing protein [Anaerolineae bacterium]|nr:toll/interleukin-1 receptor domain-containing protein [Anaerolineae bacterium]